MRLSWPPRECKSRGYINAPRSRGGPATNTNPAGRPPPYGLGLLVIIRSYAWPCGSSLRPHGLDTVGQVWDNSSLFGVYALQTRASRLGAPVLARMQIGS